MTDSARPPLSGPGTALPDGLPTPRRYLAVAGILAAIVLAVLDGAIANVALPTFALELKVAPAASIWIITSYQMALVMALLPCAALGESIGYRKVFIAGVALFTAASALCAFSGTLTLLVMARFLQGLGAAAIMSLIAAMLRSTYPAHMLRMAISWNALVVALASAAGPTIGAGILSVAHWPWLFAVNIPIGILVLSISASLPRTEGSHRPVDVISVLLNCGVFAPLVFGVDQLATRPERAAICLPMAALCLWFLIRREMREATPLIPLDLLRAPPFRLSVMASVCCFAAQTVSFVALPFYLQHDLAQDAFTTGLLMTPWPLTVACAAPLAGRLSERVATGLLCAIGAAALALGLAAASFWPVRDHLWLLVVFMVASGLGFGFFQTPNNLNMLLSAPHQRSGAAGGMQGTARLTGQTAGAVIMALTFGLIPAAQAPRAGLAVGAVLAVAAALISSLRIGQMRPSSSPESRST